MRCWLSWRTINRKQRHSKKSTSFLYNVENNQVWGRLTTCLIHNSRNRIVVAELQINNLCSLFLQSFHIKLELLFNLFGLKRSIRSVPFSWLLQIRWFIGRNRLLYKSPLPRRLLTSNIVILNSSLSTRNLANNKNIYIDKGMKLGWKVLHYNIMHRLFVRCSATINNWLIKEITRKRTLDCFHYFIKEVHVIVFCHLHVKKNKPAKYQSVKWNIPHSNPAFG